MDNTQKFTGKAAAYANARPGYAAGLFDLLAGELPLNAAVADIGSGTGILTKELLRRGYSVCAVEPNADMRACAETDLAGCSGFRSIAAPAEHTTLPGHSMDAVTAAQSFHWFDPAAFQTECRRILKPGGRVYLIWNNRDSDSPIVRENYSICQEYCPGVQGFSGGNAEMDAVICGFFGGTCEKLVFENNLYFDRPRFLDRLRSASYSPAPEDPVYAPYMAALEALFGRYARDGVLEMPNQTVVYRAPREGAGRNILI